MAFVRDSIIVENARLQFKNFEGRELKFNPAGIRNFGVIFDDHEMAEHLKALGWNIKYLKPRDEYEEPTPWLKVAVAFGKRPPDIYLISSAGKVRLDESDVGILDWANLETVDLSIRPYNYEVNGRTGVKAYLKTLYATLREDEFEKKYVNIPESVQSHLFDTKKEV